MSETVTFQLDKYDLGLITSALYEMLDDPDQCDDCIENYGVLYEGFLYALTTLEKEEEEAEFVRVMGEI